MLVFVEGGKPDNLEKNPRSKGKDQQQTQALMIFFLLMQTKGHYIHSDKRDAYTNKIQFYAYTKMIYIERNTTCTYKDLWEEGSLITVPIPFLKRFTGHLTGCGGADPHNSLTSASSAS